MNTIIADKLPDLLNLCQRYKIKSLYLFGSANTGRFSSDSDIDLLVTFEDIDLYDYFDNFIELKEELEKIFGRPVDLVEEKIVKNPILRRSIDRNKVLLYGRAS